MKFKNWTPKQLIEWLALLPSSPIMDSRNKIRIRGEITIDNATPKGEYLSPDWSGQPIENSEQE